MVEEIYPKFLDTIMVVTIAFSTLIGAYLLNDKEIGKFPRSIFIISFIISLVGSIFSIIEYRNFVEKIQGIKYLGSLLLIIALITFLIGIIFNQFKFFSTLGKNAHK